MRPFLSVSALASACALAACGTAPLSFFDGRPFERAPLNRYPVRVVAVDGQAFFHNPVQVAPGPHTLIAEAAPGGGAAVPIQKAFAFQVEPCTRYILAADRASPLLADWQLVVESKEKVGGCNPEEELRKAKAGSS